MKEKYDHRLLLKHLPSDLRVFLEHIQVYGDRIAIYAFISRLVQNILVAVIAS